MITRQFPLDLLLEYPLNKEFRTDKIVFFDIETTGFSAQSSYLYLIGCVYTEGSSLHMVQWFSENIKEEAILISNFFNFIKDYDLLIHYNGSGFDIPYITKKCEMLELSFSFDDIQSLDIYKQITPIKKIFKLFNYKQKTIEAFLKVKRDDIFSGGDLIEVYQSYLGQKHIENLKASRNLLTSAKDLESSKLLHLLLLHNEDDIKGLVSISPILYYSDLLKKPFTILQASVNEGQLIIHLEYDFSLPVQVSFGNDSITVRAFGSSTSITINIFEGELKHFYDNYKDYYYLPQEDRAIHKSLGIFVDKEFRKNAKVSNCYTKKHGLFVPQYQNIASPSFKKEYNDKLSYGEIHTDFLLKEDNLTAYIYHILNYLATLK